MAQGLRDYFQILARSTPSFRLEAKGDHMTQITNLDDLKLDGRSILFAYYIPTFIKAGESRSVSPTPSEELYKMAVRIDGSVWIAPPSRIVYLQGLAAAMKDKGC